MIATIQQFYESYLAKPDDIESAVDVHRMNLYHYAHEGVLAWADKLLDSRNVLRDIDATHCRAMAKLFSKQNYSYCRGMMEMYASSTFYSKECHVRYSVAHCRRHWGAEIRLLHGHARWLLSAPLCQNVLKRERDGVRCNTTMIALRALCWKQDHLVLPGSRIDQTRERQYSNWVTRRDVFSGLQGLQSYVRAFKEDYGVQLFDVRVSETVEDMMFFNFLTANFWKTYLHYIRAGKMTTKKLRFAFKSWETRQKWFSGDECRHYTRWWPRNLQIFWKRYNSNTLSHKPVGQKQLQTCLFPRKFFS